MAASQQKDKIYTYHLGLRHICEKWNEKTVGSVNITFCSSDQNIRCKSAHHMTDDTSETCIHF